MGKGRIVYKIEVTDLRVDYQDYHNRNKHVTALGGISFTVSAGQFVSIIGSSGCGKSTLLSVLGGLHLPSGGGVSINGVPVIGPGLDRGFVFQQYSLFPWMTARKNVAFGIQQVHKGLSKKERLKQAGSFLEKVGLESFQDAYPNQLSGGMRQRVAIARLLAMDTEILLMDEPFAAVDAKNRTVLQDLLLSLWEGNQEDRVFPPDKGIAKKERKTVVFVTHDMDEAIIMSDRIIMLTPSPGRILRETAVPFPRPRNRTVLMQSREYIHLRRDLHTLFFNDFGSGI
jgi:NitT/TauT family transport system ATP-binding protein